MQRAKFTTSTVAAGLAGMLALAGTLVFAGHETSVTSYTGCLNVESRTLVGLAAGNSPLASCRLNQIQVHLSGGDVTSVRPGAGLEGGSTNGGAILGLKPPYQLPQACLPGAVAQWTGTAWECGIDFGLPTSAI